MSIKYLFFQFYDVMQDTSQFLCVCVCVRIGRCVNCSRPATVPFGYQYNGQSSSLMKCVADSFPLIIKMITFKNKLIEKGS